MNRNMVMIFVLYHASACATAQITQWNTNIASSAYDINNDDKTIVILAPASNQNEIFSFEAWSGSAATDIDTIEVAASVGGTIRIQVGPAPGSGHSDGAKNIRVIDLSEATTGEIVSIDISEDLGRIFGADPGFVAADTTTGTLTLRNLYNPINFGAASGSITASGLQSGCTVTATSLNALIVTFGAAGDVTLNGNLGGTIDFTGAASYSGIITINGNVTSTGQIKVPPLSGKIVVTQDLAVSSTTRIFVDGATNRTDSRDVILVKGSLTGTGGSAPFIKTGVLRNTIGIHGGMTNGSSGDEIETGNFSTTSSPVYYGAVAINYDGEGGETWTSGATVKVGTGSGSGPNGAARLWEVSACKGDFDSDGDLDGTDGSLFTSAATTPDSYYASYPGLEGSRCWHGDCNFDETFPSTGDQTGHSNLITETCCVTDIEDARCGADLNFDYETSLGDLTIFLSNFGRTDADRATGDFDSDDDVDLSDLSLLLSQFGQSCCPLNGFSPPSGSVAISVDAWDTGQYTGGGFNGEKKDFVFDVLVTINTGADDWTGCGVVVDAANGAVFRLVPSPGNPPVPTSSIPEKYTTFFSVPYAVDTSNRFDSPFPSGGIAGEYDPSSTGYTYTTTALDASWYDLNSSSNDGPAAVFRLVINVNGVTGANTSAGLGSVYFTTGSPGSGDIKVADMEFDLTHKYADSGSSIVTGSFYVTD